jgi:hypothetical protein
MRIKRKETPDFGKGAVRGLYEIEQPSGKLSWAFRYRFAGRPSKFTIGPSPEIDRKNARLIAHEAIVSVAKKTDPAAEKRTARELNRKPKPADLDFAETVTAQFLKRHVAGLGEKTQREVARYMGEIVKAWGGRRLSEITKPQIHALLDSVVDRGSPVAANRMQAWLSCLFTWAIKRGTVAANPCIGLDRPALETARDRALGDDELADLWRAADALEHPYNAFLHTLVLTGQRVREVAGLA